MELDYEYICMNLCSMTGLQVRIYQGSEMVANYQNANFSPDPAIQIIDEIMADKNNVSYWVTKEYLFYGGMKVKTENLVIVIGPTMQIQPDKTRALSILFSLGEPRARLQEFVSFLETIPRYPLLNFVQVLCATNYFLNGERLVPSDLILKGEVEFAAETLPVNQPPEDGSVEPIHNTYDFERILLSFIRSGQTGKMKEILNAQPMGRPGKIAYDELRQQKNLFVCTATLATRAAIEGGMDKEKAFSLSDLYIQSMERLYRLNDISSLMTKMLLDFTEKIAEILRGGCNSALSKNVHNYILANLNYSLSSMDIAKALRVNRTYLCEQFKLDTGKSLNTYIAELIINEAKRLLRVTNDPVVEISDLLGFSSQSYFQNVFKKLTGKTPKQFRVEAYS